MFLFKNVNDKYSYKGGSCYQELVRVPRAHAASLNAVLCADGTYRCVKWCCGGHLRVCAIISHEQIMYREKCWLDHR